MAAATGQARKKLTGHAGRRGRPGRAGTVLLARGVLAERVHRGQLVGLGTAAVAVSLLALT